MNVLRCIVAAVAVGLFFVAPVAADLGSTRVANGIVAPLYAVAPPGDTDRLFIVEKGVGGTASIRILDLNTNTVSPTPFLTLSGIPTNSERGLLGLAFHPDYDTNGRFYISHSLFGGGAGGRLTVREGTVSANPGVANTTFNTVIEISQPFDNHNGGWIGFGPNDDYLYISSGDGGSGNDPGNNGQTKSSLLGKMLRLDIDGDDFTGLDDPNNIKDYAIPADNAFAADAAFAPEVWSYGLRNPWRASFDRVTGDLWIGDVGQDNREEIDFQAGTDPAGANYGWRLREGEIQTPGVGGPPPADNVEPIHTYAHSGPRSVTGGYRYRGVEVPELYGKYVFADFETSQIWSLVQEAGGGVTVEQISGALAPGGGLAINSISSFGEDADGELYIVDIGGEVFKATSTTLRADFSRNDIVNLTDFNILASNFGDTGVLNIGGDADNDGDVDLDDFNILAAQFNMTAETVSSVPEPAGAAVVFVAGMMIAMRRRSASL